jgi:nucleotidyltransferase/DNA polymerase involved in DNA repair
MSVLCCHIPDFLLHLASRAHADVLDRPFALLDSEERVCAASAPARQSGVRKEMPARQAQMRCPDIMLQPLDMQRSQEEQDAFLGALTHWQLPVEAQNWGSAYVDLHQVADASETVQPLAAELGGRVRSDLGESLQPALGWDSGKFTARAAAAYTVPGRMRLVGKKEESHFLSPLSISLLPLPLPDQQQLHWLGIRTLGQFADLPPAAIWQRFGPAGRLAQSWSRGQDDRPVQNTVQSTQPPLEFEMDPPTSLLHVVVDTALTVLQPHLQALRDRLEGCRRLHLDMRFLDGSVKRITVTFLEATCQPDRLRQALTQRLQALEWPAELDRAAVAILETNELPAGQLTLFPELFESTSPLHTLVQKLSTRYGSYLFQGEITQPHHILAERRIHFQALV